jgi:hypothetical protein
MKINTIWAAKGSNNHKNPTILSKKTEILTHKL